MRRAHAAGLTLLLLLSTTGLGGCIAAPSAALSVAGIAGRAGASAFRGGRIDHDAMTDFETMDAAVRAAIDDLSLNVRTTDSDDDPTRSLSVLCRDDRGTRIAFYVMERTPTMTRVRISVGLLGPQSMAELALRRILENLKPPPGSTETKQRPAD